MGRFSRGAIYASSALLIALLISMQFRGGKHYAPSALAITPTRTALPQPFSSNPRGFTTIGTTTYFMANDGIAGEELWKTDGTAAGTALVKDIQPGSQSSVAEQLTNLNGTLYFLTGDIWYNLTKLWRSNGTAAGTVMVKDFGTTPVYALTASGNGLYLVSYSSDGMSATLWRYDAASGVTSALKTLASISNVNLLNINGTLFFLGSANNLGDELWKTDGSAAGTLLIKGGGSASALTNVNGTLFFSFRTIGGASQLWKSSSAGTVLVKDFPTTYSSDVPRQLTNVNGTLFFLYNDGLHHTKLWKSDGTTAGTLVIADTSTWPPTPLPGQPTLTATRTGTPRPGGPISTAPDQLTAVGNLLFFSNYGEGGRELWKSDGTVAGTVMVKDTLVGSASGEPVQLTNVNGTLFFMSNATRALWKSDGSAAGTIELKTFTYDTQPKNLRPANGYLIFAGAELNGSGHEPWRSDGSVAGTMMIKDINVSASVTPTFTSTATPTGSVTRTPTRTRTSTRTPTRTSTTPAGITLKVNFQLASGPAFPGYLIDGGAVYAARGNGQTYGWNVDNTTWARDRNAANSPDDRYDTLNHMQKGGGSLWEIALPSGSYSVRIVAGDPSNVDSVYNITAEGITVVSGTPNSTTRWFDRTQSVAVSDGRLTIANGAGSSNNKIAFIEITSATVSTPTATRTRTNTLPCGCMATATRTNTTPSGNPAWAPNTAYAVGATVSYGGLNYRCLQAHTSLTGWEPPNAPSLWQQI